MDDAPIADACHQMKGFSMCETNMEITATTTHSAIAQDDPLQASR